MIAPSPASPAAVRVRKAVASAWRPKVAEPLSDYCCRTVKLSPHWEASRGSYDLKENPFWREILDAMTDPEVRKITVKKSTRVGGTLLLVAANLGLADLDPAPAMIVTPDEPSCVELRDRTYDTALSSKHHMDKVPPERLWNTRAMDLQSNQIFMAWAGSAQRLRGRTCRRVFFSETDVYPPAIRGGGDPIKAGSERTKRSFYSLLYHESSPDGDPSSIDELHKQGNQMTWQCPCPHCGKHQELRFFVYKSGEHKGRGGVSGYKDEHGNHLSIDEARRNAHYICLNGCRIENHEKNAMVEAGKWVPKGCHVDDKTGKVEGTPEKSRRHISIHLWHVHVPMINFSELAASYLEHYVTNDLQEFFQNALGLKYRTGRKVPRWDQVGRRFESYYGRGEVPLKVFFLTAGIDVQLMGVYWAVYGWGHMCKPYVIDWGYHRRFLSDADELSDDDIEDLSYPNIASDLQQLQASLLQRRFNMFGGRNSCYGQPNMRLKGAAMDSNFRKNAVHRFVQQSRDPRLIAVRGDHTVKPRDRFRKGVVDKTRDGKQLDQEREIWGVATTYFKQEIYDRLGLQADAEQAPVFPRDMAARGADYLRQLLNEQWVEEEDRKTKKKKGYWKEVNNRLGSHYLDTFVYAYARAEIILANLGLTWDSNTWLNKRTVQQPEQLISRTYQG